MMFVRLLPVLLSAALLAAHLSRHDLTLLIPVALAFPALLLVRRPWVPRVVQAVLLVGALEWVRTGIVLGRARLAAGEPWMRMAVILGAVAVVTAASALVFRSPAVRARYTSLHEPSQ
jgi:hypothetical protein